jgi:hypothetical protein
MFEPFRDLPVGLFQTDERLQREQEAFERSRGLPEETIVGAVVHGAGGGKTPGERLLRFPHFEMVAWRIEGEPLSSEPIAAKAICRTEEVSAFQTQIKKESVVAFRGKLIPRGRLYFGFARFLSLIPDYEDAEVRAFLQAYLTPVRIVEPTFGQFELNKRVHSFEGKVDFGGENIKLVLDASSLDQCFKVARTLWNNANSWKQRAQNFAIQELLPLKNQFWLEEGQEELTVDSFANSLQLETIAVSSNGSIEFYYNDGDLFFGHTIELSGEIHGGFKRANPIG